MTKQTKPVQIGLVCFAFTRRRRTHHLHDGSFGIAQGCRPGNEGKAAPGTAHLMQKRALIAMQYSALHNRTWKTPTVQKPCKNRAETVHSWLTKQKSHEIFRFTASTVDIPTRWNPRAKQQPTGLIACGAMRRRPVRAPSIAQTKKKNQHTMCTGFSWCSKAIQIRTIFL